MSNKSVIDKFMDINSGREGMSVLTIANEEVPGSVYLGGAKYAARCEDNMILLYSYDMIKEKWIKISMNGEMLNHLIRV